MDLQAYLDSIKAETRKASETFRVLASTRGRVKSGDIASTLQADSHLDRGHANAVAPADSPRDQLKAGPKDKGQAMFGAWKTPSRSWIDLRRFAPAAVTLLATVAWPLQAEPRDDKSTLLKQQTQELLDAVTAGDRRPWTRLLHESVIYVAEDGNVRSKAQLLEDIGPLPVGISGTLAISEFRAVRHGNSAVTSYITDEQERYFGQALHAEYRNTDTWIETADGWRLVAAQVLAVRRDPPALKVAASRLAQYAGTYALTPDVSYTIRVSADGLQGQRAGRKPETLSVEVEDCLFVPNQPRLRKIFKRDADGKIIGFVERRESWDITWRRLER